MNNRNIMELLLVKDVAKELGVSVDRVRQIARDGTLSVFAKTPGGVRLFTRSAVYAEAARRATIHTQQKKQ